MLFHRDRRTTKPGGPPPPALYGLRAPSSLLGNWDPVDAEFSAHLVDRRLAGSVPARLGTGLNQPLVDRPRGGASEPRRERRMARVLGTLVSPPRMGPRYPPAWRSSDFGKMEFSSRRPPFQHLRQLLAGEYTRKSRARSEPALPSQIPIPRPSRSHASSRMNWEPTSTPARLLFQRTDRSLDSWMRVLSAVARRSWVHSRSPHLCLSRRPLCAFL